MRSLLILCALALVLTACRSSADQKIPEAPIPVYAVTVAEEDVPVYIESLGVLKPAVSVELRSRVNGVLQQVHFKEGELIRKGASLFVIDPIPYAIKLQEAEAQLAHSQAGLEAFQKKIERYRGLTKKEVFAPTEWDELESKLTQSEAQVKGDQARVAQAQYELQHCSLSAPIEGIAGKLGTKVGNIVSPLQENPLVTLANCDELKVEFSLTEKELGKIPKKSEIPLYISSTINPDRKAQGTLTFFDNAFDTTTGLILASGIFTNADHVFIPGQGVNVQISVDILKNVIFIPVKAVKMNQLGPYVFVIGSDNKVALRQIHLGQERKGRVVVLEGLKNGEQIVTDGHLRLSADALIEIQKGEI